MKHQHIQFVANTLCNLAIAVSALPFVAVVLDPSLMGLFDLTSYLGLRGPLQASSSLLIAGVVLLVLFALQLAIIVTTKKIVLGFASFSRGELDASKLFVQLSKYTLIATLYLPFVRMVLNALFQHELNGVYMVVLGFNRWDGMGLMLGLLCLVASLYMQLAQTAIDDNRQIV